MANLSDKQYLELSKFSYLYEKAFKKALKHLNDDNPTLAELAHTMLYDQVLDENNMPVLINLVQPGKVTGENGGLFDKDFRDTLMFIKNDPILSELEFIENRNHNSSTGFVGMVFKDAGDNRSPQRHAA